MVEKVEDFKLVIEGLEELKGQNKKVILKDTDLLAGGLSLNNGARSEYADMFIRNILRNLPKLGERGEIKQEFYECPPNILKIKLEDKDLLRLQIASYEDGAPLNPELEEGVLVRREDFEQEILSKAEFLSEQIFPEDSNHKESMDEVIENFKESKK